MIPMVRSASGNSVRRIITRDYVCPSCGTLRKAPAHYVPHAPPPPACCQKPMQSLGYDQKEACTRMTKQKRVKWLLAGGKVERRDGKRKWRAVM